MQASDKDVIEAAGVERRDVLCRDQAAVCDDTDLADPETCLEIVEYARQRRQPGTDECPERYRVRDWDTRVGTIELAIPQLRQGSYFPGLLEPRRRAEQAMVAVVAQCYIEGVSTRRVDDVVQAMGAESPPKHQVSDSRPPQTHVDLPKSRLGCWTNEPA